MRIIQYNTMVYLYLYWSGRAGEETLCNTKLSSPPQTILLPLLLAHAQRMWWWPLRGGKLSVSVGISPTTTSLSSCLGDGPQHPTLSCLRPRDQTERREADLRPRALQRTRRTSYLNCPLPASPGQQQEPSALPARHCGKLLVHFRQADQSLFSFQVFFLFPFLFPCSNSHLMYFVTMVLVLVC